MWFNTSQAAEELALLLVLGGAAVYRCDISSILNPALAAAVAQFR